MNKIYLCIWINLHEQKKKGNGVNQIYIEVLNVKFVCRLGAHSSWWCSKWTILLDFEEIFEGQFKSMRV